MLLVDLPVIERHSLLPHEDPEDLLDGSGIEPLEDGARCAGDQRPGDDRQAPDVGERQAGHPAVAARVDPEPRRGETGRGDDRVAGVDDAFRLAGGAAGGDDQGVTRLDGEPAVEGGASRRGHHGGGAQRGEESFGGRAGESGVHREHGVAGVPDRPEGIDEAWAGREIECHQLSHAGSLATVRVATLGVNGRMVAPEHDGDAGAGEPQVETVVSGPPVDPVDRFRGLPLPVWESRGDYTDIRMDVADGIAKLTICRPEVRNAFRPQTLFELSDAFNVAGDDAVARQGIGRLNVLDLQIQIRRLPKPVVAMVAGYAIGGGHILHLVCDLTVAADNARFGQTGPKVGSFDGGYGASLLARSIGLKRAKEVWFLCRQYDAATVKSWGLVNEVVPLADLEAETVAWCRQMLSLSPLALRMLKGGLHAADDGLAGLQQFAGDATMLFYMSEEGQEGRNAFQEHRPPDFGRFPRRP